MSWRMQFFAPPSGPGYVKDGLVLWLDGIWNAGVGVHDLSATEWVNLVDGSRFALSGDVSVLDNAMDFNRTGTDGVAAGRLVLPAGDRTLEFCLLDLRSTGASAFLAAPNTVPTPYYTYAGNPAMYTPRLDESIAGYSFIGRSYTRASVFTDAAREYDDGAFFSAIPNSAGKPLPVRDGAMTIANRLPNKDRATRAGFASVRIYNRALSPDEIAQNYAVDKERFNLP